MVYYILHINFGGYACIPKDCVGYTASHLLLPLLTCGRLRPKICFFGDFEAPKVFIQFISREHKLQLRVASVVIFVAYLPLRLCWKIQNNFLIGPECTVCYWMYLLAIFVFHSSCCRLISTSRSLLIVISQYESKHDIIVLHGVLNVSRWAIFTSLIIENVSHGYNCLQISLLYPYL